ncbi:RHS repeat domain-containing protein, partial [Bathymodiolus thermophilus thioautotrophic gill symbiont]
EHIDEMGFIHMNGRVYDPSIGRFLSADPNIQAPYNTQSYNRYSYVLNNPLKYTDPSGFWFEWLEDFVGKVENLMMKNATLRAIGMAAASMFGGPAGAAAFSARMAYLSGASDGDILKAAIVSFASASAAEYIGHGGVDGGSIVEGATNKAIAHGLAQGAISQISGGSFQDGFTGGFIGSVAGSSMGEGGDWSDIAGRTAIAATAGGAVAVLGGGKFSNGARSAAFVHLFNAEGGSISKKWKQEKTIFDNSSHGFIGGRFLKIESRSGTAGFDSFRYEVRGYPLKVDGSLGSVVAPIDWGYYTSSGGFGMGSTRVIDSGPYNKYGTYWKVSIPLQPSTHNNSYGHHINIYHSD